MSLLIEEMKLQYVECYRRGADNSWEKLVSQGGDTVVLVSINLEFPVSKLYVGIDECHFH